MSWNELELDIETLEAETIYKVNENVDFIKTELEKRGYVLSVAYITASYDTFINKIREVLQTIEDDLTELNSTIYESQHFYRARSIERKFTIDDYRRWVLILNEMYDMLINGKGRWTYLILKDNNYALDKKEFYIFVRKTI